MSEVAKVSVKTGAFGWLGDILVSLSATNLLLLGIWQQLFYESGKNLYLLPNYTWHSYVSAVILLLLFSAAFLFALRKLRTTDGIRAWLINTAAPIAYILLIANSMRQVFTLGVGKIIEELIDPSRLGFVFFASAVVLSVVWLLRKKLAMLLYIALLIFSPFAFLNVIYSVWNGTLLVLEKEPAAIEKTYVGPGDHPGDRSSRGKTILLIFDALDYSMAFEENLPGVNLKNLNYLKQESLFFTEVKSVYANTWWAIPSITMGRSIIVSYMGENDLKITFHDPGSSKTTWRETETIFSQLDKAGKSIALVGYYHPYCDVFGDVVDYCKQYSTIEAIEIQSSNSVFDSMVKQLISLIPVYRTFRALNAIDIHKSMRRDTLEILAHEEVDFVYVHFNMPHNPYIYDRESKKLIINHALIDGYLDNLQLTDILLGDIISTLKENDLWDTSTLIVSADHYWREQHKWKKQHSHDSVLSKKVPLIVKLPMQDRMHISDAEISVLHIKPLIEKIMFDKILDPAALAKEFETPDG